MCVESDQVVQWQQQYTNSLGIEDGHDMASRICLIKESFIRVTNIDRSKIETQKQN